MHDRGLGRLVSFDEQDRDYPIRALFAGETVLPASRYWWNLGARLDQGNTGTCVGHGWVHYLENGPVTQPGQLDPIDFYRECTKVDEWPGNDDGDLQFGSSVRAGAKVAQAKGLITEYRWAFTFDEALVALMTVGPLVLGTDWYTGMFKADGAGFIKPTGQIEGGHCYVVDGANLKERKARILNSWGPSWGVKGTAWITFDDLDYLIREQGECCMAKEVRMAP